MSLKYLLAYSNRLPCSVFLCKSLRKSKTLQHRKRLKGSYISHRSENGLNQMKARKTSELNHVGCGLESDWTNPPLL